MEIKTLAELQEPDARTLRFTPHGLGIGVQMTPEGAAQFQQECVAGLELAAAVADGTRQSFEHLRAVFAHGIMCYEIFTLVGDHALLVIEQALRDRFLEWHHGTLILIDLVGAEHSFSVTDYEDVIKLIRKHAKWKLRLSPGRGIAFNGMLNGLYGWARGVGLLRGHRNRGQEKALTALRNFVAHANGYHLHGPVEAVRTLSDVAEIINQLWGVATPGGRLYPAPLRREVIATVWDDDGKAQDTGLARDLNHEADVPGWTCVVLRAYFRPEELRADPGLREYDSWYEATRFPADLLWGPGPVSEAARWVAEHDPQPDECDYLDRVFVVQEDNGRLFLPMRPSVAAALPAEMQAGTWRAMRCDHADAAWNHARNLVTGRGCSDADDICVACLVENLRTGALADVLGSIGPAAADLPPSISTPWANPRSKEISEL
ncbi:hypothetical protein [Catelliglobosispora koreensis]|uniref:hypothetical protein n=1 Tax=Catelliglobosispora koreensis TaxID=129052 RepID=UPI00036AE532|nr:hypothetical protein [Catelliglobosispora koreensis]